MRHALLLLAGFATPVGAAYAQAWLPPAGDVALTFNYSYVLNKKHYTATGDEVDVGHTRSDTLGLQGSWAPADRWLLIAGVPWVRTRFLGESAHGPEVDHGHGNTYFTDLRLELHYQAMTYPLAIAPYVAAVIPTNDYPTLGHAAPGRGLNETWVGLFAGRSFDTLLPGSYLQLRYNYAFVEKVVGISHDHSNLDIELGYFLSPSWSVQAAGSWRWAHGGIDLPVPPTDPLYPYHDQLGAAEYFNLSGGVAWFPSPRYSFFLAYSGSLEGSNAHKVDRGLALSLGWRPMAR